MLQYGPAIMLAARVIGRAQGRLDSRVSLEGRDFAMGLACR
jgi:hypothetical protein